jgi:SAM-dependent methyltransferase
VGTEARAANRQVYANPCRATAYVDEPYHRTRREIAATTLVRRGGATGPVLELGVGARPMLTAADCPGGGPVVLADLEPAALDRARGPAVRLDATAALPFRAGVFSGVLVGELIEHVFDPVRLLEECARVLRPGGVLVLTTPNLSGVQDRLRFLVGKPPRHIAPLHPYLRLHIRPLNRSLARRLLDRAGFEAVDVRSNYVGWELPDGRWVQSRLLGRLAPGLGGSLIVSARTPRRGPR